MKITRNINRFVVFAAAFTISVCGLSRPVIASMDSKSDIEVPRVIAKIVRDHLNIEGIEASGFLWPTEKHLVVPLVEMATQIQELHPDMPGVILIRADSLRNCRILVAPSGYEAQNEVRMGILDISRRSKDAIVRYPGREISDMTTHLRNFVAFVRKHLVAGPDNKSQEIFDGASDSSQPVDILASRQRTLSTFGPPRPLYNPAYTGWRPIDATQPAH